MYYIVFILSPLFLLLFSVNIKNLDAQDGDYRVGVEDKLYIAVWENKELTREVSVRLDGKISLPLIGELKVEGLTCQEITQLIINNVGTYIKNPNVFVVLKSINNYKVYIMGGVKLPGVYNLKRKTDLFHLIIMAGGFTSNEYICLENSYILREKDYISVDIKKMIEEKNLDYNINLLPNDIVYIPDNCKKHITVIGEVMSPGKVIFKNNITVMDAILKAGGTTEDAHLNGTKIIRKNGDRRNNSKKKIKVPLKKIMKEGDLDCNIQLQPNDIVIIPASIF